MADPNRPVMLTADAARRIGRAVQAYEQGRARIPAKPLRTAAGDDGGETMRLCRTSCAFDKGTVQTLAVWEDGTPPNETISAGETVQDVVNKYADIEANAFVSVALHGNGRWYVVSAECGVTAGS